jgi:hypothetical protein
MEVKAAHSICYETSSDMTVSTVAKSLLANERMIIEACGLLSEIFPDLLIEKKTVKVGRIQHQSPLREVLLVSIFVSFQEELTKEVPVMIERIFGKEIPADMDTIVTVLVFIVATQIITMGIEKAFPGKSIPKLKNELEDKIAIASKFTGATKEEIRLAVQNNYAESSKGSALLNKAYDFFRPSKLSNDCAITTEHGFEVSELAIMEIPTDLEFMEQDDIQTYEIDGAVLEIHRTDRDYNKQGWRAVLRDVTDKPLKMELAPNLKPSDLYGSVEIVGDVIVVEEKQVDGMYLPKALHLLAVHEVKDKS